MVEGTLLELFLERLKVEADILILKLDGASVYLWNQYVIAQYS